MNDTMTTRELAEFFGKSEDTILKKAREAGISSRQGRAIQFDRAGVESMAVRLFKTVPLAVKESINMTFSTSVKPGSSLPENAEVKTDDYVRRGMELVFGAIGKLDERVSRIESEVGERRALLPAPQMSPRDHINKIVREYAANRNIGFSEAYRTLYSEFGYRTHSNPSAAAKNRGMAIIDYIEAEGQIETLEAIAMEVFK